jgi:hypothetical protein
MKIHDLLTEQRLDEKPMGFLKSLGNKTMAAFGSGKAQGKVEAGTMANQLRKQYDIYLGKTGEDATADSIIDFLKSKDLPTSAAEKMLGGSAAPAETPAAPDAAAPATGSNQPATSADKPAQAATTDTPPAPADKPAAEKPAAGAAAQDDKAAIAARVKANVGKTAAATKASGFGGPVEKPKPDTGAAAFGQMAQQLSTPKEKPATTTKPTTGGGAFGQMAQQLTTQKAEPAADTPAATTPPARAQGGGRVSGQLSQTPGAIKKRQNRAVRRRTGHPADDNPNINLGGESFEYDMDGQELMEYVARLLNERALDNKTVDNIFMAAAQEAAKLGFKPGEEIGFAGGFKAGKDQEGGFSDNLAKAYKGQSSANAQSKAPADAGLQDETGLIPKDILKQINQLKFRERQQLLKELG